MIRRSERNYASRQDLPLTVRTLAAEPNPGFEALSAPAVFRSGASFGGRFYLSGPAGLFAYSSAGNLEHIYRAGFELPAVRLGHLAAGTLADSRTPELLIATEGEGVLAFDGQRFRQIRATDADARNVTTLLPLSSGRLLLGTARRGLLAYDGKTLQSFHARTNDVFITALAGDETELWIGTIDRGVLHWRGGQVETIGEANGLPDPRVEAISLEGGATYIGTPAGVAELLGGKVTRVLAPGRYAHAVLADAGQLFVGQMQGGVLPVSSAIGADRNSLRRPIAITREDNSNRPPNPDVSIEGFLRVGDARFAVAGNQLLRLEPDGQWRSVLGANQAMLTDRNVSSVMVASDGRIWIGYFDRGLDILPATDGSPLHIENEQVFCVNRIVENARQGVVAVATANGLVLFDRDGRQKQLLTRESGLIASHVTDIALLGDGMVAATPAGITFLDPSGPHSMYAFQGLVNNHVYALGQQRDELLVGTLGGISLVSGGAVRRNFTTGNSGLKANWITALTSTGGDWLIGTYGAGILRMSLDGAVTTTETTAQGAVINPGAMAADAQVVLAGTLGKGLLVSDGSGTRWKTVTNGLPSLNVTALAVDRGTIYVGTDNGLVKIAEGRL